VEWPPEGLPIEVFDGFRKALADNRAQFFLDVAAGPFYGFNRDGAAVREGVVPDHALSDCRAVAVEAVERAGGDIEEELRA
jgi:hypothetical protein